jgi:cyclase
MEIKQLATDLLLLIGDTYHSNTTVFINGDELLLVDAMASLEDGEKLVEFINKDLAKKVRFIISTHYFSDHIASLRFFPQASIIAHIDYRKTFESEKFRTEKEAEHYVEPTILISDRMVMRWGGFNLDIFHNPGHTLSTLNIDVPEADLLMTSDTVVGNIVYFQYSTPTLIESALQRLQSRKRAQVIKGHWGNVDFAVIEHALYYLDSLRTQVTAANSRPERDELISQISLASCLPADINGSAFENIYHRRNLETIIERKLFLV